MFAQGHLLTQALIHRYIMVKACKFNSGCNLEEKDKAKERFGVIRQESIGEPQECLSHFREKIQKERQVPQM